jgi:CelD/BcsL family acetyltransferase involved in cellulose biosynthesis
MVLVHAASIFREKAARPSEWTVEVVTTYADFVALEGAWNTVVERAGLDHPFARHEWIRTWWDCFGSGRKLHIVLVRSRDELVAVAPFMLSQGRMYGLPVRRLELIFNVHTPRLDVVATRSHREVYRALWRYLSERRDLWDVLTLYQLPEGTRTLAGLGDAAQGDGFPVGVWRSDDSPYVSLSAQSAEAYFAGLEAKFKSNLRNRWKRLARLGTVAVETVSTARGLPEALEQGFQIEALAWKGDTGTAIRCSEELSRFYSRIARVAAQKGWLRLHFLTVEGRAIAFAYSLVYGRKFYLLKTGYDPEYFPYSPFNLLCEQLLKESFEEGCLEFDFLGSSADWKMRWTKTVRPHQWLFVFGRSAKARFIHWAKFRMASVVREQPLLRPLVRWLRAHTSHDTEPGPTAPVAAAGRKSS